MYLYALSGSRKNRGGEKEGPLEKKESLYIAPLSFIEKSGERVMRAARFLVP